MQGEEGEEALTEVSSSRPSLGSVSMDADGDAEADADPEAEVRLQWLLLC
jgi:hypothetical protein